MVLKPLAVARKRISRAKPSYLLIGAACLHVLTALGVYAAARLSILPGPFIAGGLGQFSFDSSRYLQEAKTLVEILISDGIVAWLGYPLEFHVHLYSLSLAILSPLFGYSVLAIEPLNLFFYLASLIFIYLIGKEALGRGAGLIAAMIIALWPSFLLHTTQFLKDPLFIVCMLALVFVCMTWLTRIGSWKSALLKVLLGVASIATLARMKGNMWESVGVIVMVGFLLLIARQARARRILAPNMLSAALMITFALLMPVRTTNVHKRDILATQATEQVGHTSFVWTLLGARIAERRRVFNRFGGSQASTIDGAVFFNDTEDILHYLPRATLIGLFAPFPHTWLAPAATTGRVARFLSGAETFLFYLVALAAGVCLYVDRRNFSTWFLFLVALVNMVALGLIVTNLGTLFRLRYVFWMLIIILGARGLVILACRNHRLVTV